MGGGARVNRLDKSVNVNVFFPGDTHCGGWMRMNDRQSVKEGEREFVCSDLCSAPHRTYHYQMSQWGWLPAESLLIALNSNSSSLSFFSLSALSLFFPFLHFFFLFFFSCFFFFTLFFGARTARAGRVLHQLFSVLRGARRSDPSLLLSLSLPSLSSVSLPLSSPCCDRAHLLDLGYTRSESNYPIGPRSHFTVSSPPLDWIFWESSSPLLSSLRLASTENR